MTTDNAIGTESKRTQSAFRAVAVGIPICIGLAIALGILVQRGLLQWDESGIRWVAPPLYLEEPGHERTGHRYLYDATLGWRNIPNWKATTHGKPLSINSQGLRDSEHGFEKPEGVRRVLVLGDSYTWGYGVGDQEIFCHLLERRFQDRGESVEVINSGVSGWGTDQELLYLRQEGLKYLPDVVVVALFIGNDLDNNVAAEQYLLHKPVFADGQLTLENSPVPKPRQYASDTLRRSLASLDPVEHTVAILGGISETCEQANCQLVLMKFGNFLAPDLPRAQDLERRFEASLESARLSLKYFDLDERFAERGLNAVMLTQGNDDGHWNAFGHARVAEELDRFLVDSTRQP